MTLDDLFAIARDAELLGRDADVLMALAEAGAAAALYRLRYPQLQIESPCTKLEAINDRIGRLMVEAVAPFWRNPALTR